MPPKRSPRAQRLARKLLLLPVLVVALPVAAAPAVAAQKKSTPGKGAAAAEAHKPYGVGQARKIK